MRLGRRFPLLLGLFVASGFSALIYEIVWFQLLELIIGSTAVSLAVLLAAFMGGMCAGSLFSRYLFPQRLHPLKTYAAIELGIALCGVGMLWVVPLVERGYALLAASWGTAGIGLRAIVALLCLLPPAVLMGAALPVMARWIEGELHGVSWLGYLYGGNTGGAIAGCLVAGFYLLRLQDVATATYAAASLNIAVAAAALTLASRTAFIAPPIDRPPPQALPRPVMLSIALSGCCALGAEVVWTRILSLMLGGTVYTFSLILAGVLLGLGLGAAVGSWSGRRLRQPRLALGWCQMMAAAALAASGWLLATTVPFWFVAASDTWARFGKDFLRSLAATLPATFFWGASFPLALRAGAGGASDAENLVGSTYASNTAGAVVGALAFALIAIPALGAHGSERLLITLALVSGFVAWAHSFREMKVALAGTVAIGASLLWTLPALPWGIVTHGRQFATTKDLGKLIHLEEGMNSSIAVSELDGTTTFHVSGKVEASSGAEDMRMQRMLGHLPAVLHASPKRVLVVGCGAGVTAGSFVVHPEVERIVVCEIEARTPKVASQYFHHENHGVLRDQRTVLVNDDARHYILTTAERFDIITSDPIHPWVKGSATLYTREYFELCKRRLRPGGMVVQWVPLYESTPQVVQSELATFFEAFPAGTIWSNDTLFGEGYDIVLLGSVDPMLIDVDRLQERFDRSDFVLARKSMREVGLGSAVNLLGTYGGRAADLRTWLAGAAINQDRNLRLQYLAGLGLNRQDASGIYEQILARRKYPQDLFRAAPATQAALRKAMGMRD